MNKEVPNRNPEVRKRILRIINFIVSGVILAGILVMAYPFISQNYYKFIEYNQAKKFDREVKRFSKSDIERRIELAEFYNESLLNRNVSEYEKANIEKGVAEYGNMLEVHENIGHISIPRIKQDIPVFAGISDEMLDKGVGHMQGTSLPIGGKNTHAVLAAHSGLPDIKLFTDLNKVRVGDKFYITNVKETLAYKVDRIKVVLPSQFDDLAIIPDGDYVTLMTCTPYMVNTHRLLVRGHRVAFNQDEKDRKESYIKKYMAGFIIIVSLISVLIILLIIRKIRKKSGGGNPE